MVIGNCGRAAFHQARERKQKIEVLNHNEEVLENV